MNHSTILVFELSSFCSTTDPHMMQGVVML